MLSYPMLNLDFSFNSDALKNPPDVPYLDVLLPVTFLVNWQFFTSFKLNKCNNYLVLLQVLLVVKL